MSKSGFTNVVVVLFAACALYAGDEARAHHYVASHELNCSRDFPCPDALRGRVNFWVHVFSRWGKKQAILHDPNVPERVYSIIDTGEGCSRRVKKKINKERKRIKTALYNAALKLESGKPLSGEDKHLASMFPDAKPTDLRRASENIRCQGGVRESYLAGLERFRQYEYMVDEILAQYPLSPDIRYLPFVESSYNPKAYSKAGAAGMWQIMPRTARVLGLELNAAVDERLEPEAATHAAARYLTDAKKQLTSLARRIDPSISEEEINPFVITSYNYGVNGMKRAIRQVKPDYLAVLNRYRSPSFQVAVKNFYSSFLAARHVALNTEHFFGKISPRPVRNFTTVALKDNTSVERVKQVFGVSEEELRPINLGLTRFIWNGWRLIPAGYQLKLPPRDGGYEAQIRQLRSLAPETFAPGSGNYIVRKGDTACGIARALRVNCRELISMNRLGKRALIRVGQKLDIPKRLVVRQGTQNRGAGKVTIAPETAPASPFLYTVSRGDTACAIARRFRVSCRELIRVNKLGRKAVIRIGQQLEVPGHRSREGTVARLDENNQYLVVEGDTACAIARRFNVSCKALTRLNRLNRKGTIYPGQRLKVPGYDVPDTSETAEQLAQIDKVIAGTQPDEAVPEAAAGHRELTNLLDTLPDLSVMITEGETEPVYRVRVESNETLGHYADWLGIGSAKPLRKLNRISSGDNMNVGQLIRIPVTSASEVDRFERKRSEFHQVLNEELKEHYDLTGIYSHTVKRGDTVWSMSQQAGFPVWLFYKLNPELKSGKLANGTRVLLPRLQKKG